MPCAFGGRTAPRSGSGARAGYYHTKFGPDAQGRAADDFSAIVDGRTAGIPYLVGARKCAKKYFSCGNGTSPLSKRAPASYYRPLSSRPPRPARLPRSAPIPQPCRPFFPLCSIFGHFAPLSGKKLPLSLRTGDYSRLSHTYFGGKLPTF